ncbi:M50 family metallopeptidase, partial [Patescibacteria group bacterium]|nr:M50 family metallopeptidase [Patescibacteria group bacterium]
FGLGIPPKIFGKKIGETIFSLNWLPIGGFCRLYGEDPTTKLKSQRAFCNKNVGQKTAIIMGGVMMNVVLAVLIFSVVYSIVGIPKETDRVKVIEVASGSPAEKAGILVDDWIVGVGQVAVKKGDQLIEEVDKCEGGRAELVIRRGDLTKTLEIEVRENPPEGEGKMGVAISTQETVKIPWWQFYRGIGAGFREAYFWGKIIAGGMCEMVAGLFSGRVPQGVAGPVGMYQATSSIKREQGFLAMVHFFGIISVNLAILNFMPFPALDGGRMVFVAIEAIRKKKLDPRIEARVNTAGMLLLLLLLLLVSVGDVARIIK